MWLRGRHYFAANRTLGLSIPDKNPDRSLSPMRPVAALLKDYKGKAAWPGRDFDSTAASIEHRTIRGKLANGMQYALLPKRPAAALSEPHSPSASAPWIA